MNIICTKTISDNRILDYKVSEDLFEKIKIYDYVLIQNENIDELGIVINKTNTKTFKNEAGEGEIKKILTPEDKEKASQIKEKAINTIMEAQEIINNHNLKMNIVDADLSFDEKKLTFYFSAESRVDFRRLVTELVKHFKKIIRLQQIGSREQLQKIGGYGKCGQEVCCKRFLKNIGNVSLEFSKNQNLSDTINNKINGACGKLMCCLAYENENYLAEKKNMPKIGDEYKSKEGSGIIVKQNIIEKSITVKTKDNKFIKIKL